MKFSAQLALACFSAGVLSNVTRRDPSDLSKDLDIVQKVVDELNTAVNEFRGNTSPVQAAATKLVDTIISVNTELSTQATLSLAATFELDTHVTSFITHVKTLIESLKTKLPVVKAAGQCGLVRENIHAINTAAGTLIGTVVVHCNPAAEAIAKKKEETLLALLNGCKEDYSTSNCP